MNFHYRHIQTHHALLSNYGIIAQLRYLIESVGPEFRQYLYSSDTEERPFSRVERSEVYRKSKDIDSSAAFGSQLNFDHSELKLKHSFYPIKRKEIDEFTLTFGEERKLEEKYTIHKPFMISGMSYGALGERAVRSLARGAKKIGIPMNTGEGGFPKHHLKEGCDLIFQIGTAKFGVRGHDGTLDDHKLEKIARTPEVKMVEIKFSQGAKPGKGGLLPKEKITQEIAELRGIPLGKDVISPPSHIECVDKVSTVKFIRKIQEITQVPVGMKICLGREKEFAEIVQEMKKQKVNPDYIAVDGSEGGTGAAPKSFMDDLGLPLFIALPKVTKILSEYGIRDKLKIVASGKLINVGRQFMAMSMGADAVYTARGFMLAIGCIQALQCNKNTCPVGITTHDPHLVRGIDIEDKSKRVYNYVNNLYYEYKELLSAMGMKTPKDLKPHHLYAPDINDLV